MYKRALAPSAAAFVLVAALAGCGKGQNDGSSGLAQVNPSASAPFGSPSPDDSSSAVTTPGATPTSTKTATATYPTTAEGYASAALAAFGSGNSGRLASLAGPGGGEFANIGQPNKHWHYYKDAPDGVYTDSFFDNDDGDRITVVIDPAGLGKPGAVHGVSIDKTAFGSTADNAVVDLVQALLDGNKYRMTVLSDAHTTSLLRSFAKPSSSNLTDDTASKPGHTIVTIHFNSFTFIVDVTRSKLGHAHAITAVTTAD